MGGVRVLSSSIIVLPSSSTPHRIELTPWDLQVLLLGPIQKGLLFPKPKPSQELQPVIDHLKTSFCRALELFPLLAGRLGVVKHSDEMSSFFIDCNNAGAEFIHAIAEDVTVADIVDPLNVPRIVHSFFPLNGYSNYAGISKALLAVQVTELADGFFIGCTMNHVVGDGTSFWMFFNSWSDISRSDTLSQTPSFHRWAPDGVHFPLTVPLYSGNELINSQFPDLEERVFHFSRQKIMFLKRKADPKSTLVPAVSSLQAVLAHLWVAIATCHEFDLEENLECTLFVGARTRLQPLMSEGYFGNAIHPAVVTVTAGDLVAEDGLGFAAREMNKVIVSQSDETVRNFYSSWVKEPIVFKMDGLIDGKCMSISSSPRNNVYGNDFGWGKPLAVRSGGSTKRSGKITVFPGAEEGSIDIEVCLFGPILASLGEDKEFMEQ